MKVAYYRTQVDVSFRTAHVHSVGADEWDRCQQEIGLALAKSCHLEAGKSLQRDSIIGFQCGRIL